MRKSDDLISRRATYLALVEKGQASKRYRLGETWELNGKEISEVLDNLPSAQPEERKRGKWIPYSPEGLRYKCSVCESRYETPWHFCPNCGSYNGGVQSEND